MTDGTDNSCVTNDCLGSACRPLLEARGFTGAASPTLCNVDERLRACDARFRPVG